MEKRKKNNARLLKKKVVNKNNKKIIMPWVDQNKCNGCKACVNICPVGAISIENGKAIIDQEKCIHCGKCLNICPQGAIRPNSENSNLREHRPNGSGEGFGFGRRRGMGGYNH